MEREFNLIDEPWILVRTSECEVKQVNLKDVFFNAHKYIDLAGETKAQDFAVLRLLLAITHTVFSRYDLQGNEIDIENESVDYLFDNWENIWNTEYIKPEPFESYFEKWKERFWLFDEKYPFYQSNAVKGKRKETYKTNKLIGTLLESENKNTIRLFAGRKGNESTIVTYAEAVRWLLYLNCFDDTSAKAPSPKITWVSKLGAVYLKGKNLFETIMLNYVAETDSDNPENNLPSWETEQSTEFNRAIALPDNQALLLSLRSRTVYLCRENGGVTGYYVSGGDYFSKNEKDEKGNFIEENDVYLEQMTIWCCSNKKNEETKIRPALLSQSKMAWQEFGSIAIVTKKDNNSGNGERLPGIILWVKKLQERKILDKNYMMDIRMLSVIYDAKHCKVTDTISDNLKFHSQLLLDVGGKWRNHICNEIKKCEEVAQQVERLSVNLQRCSGASTDKISGKSAKNQFYRNIDEPFRLWLSQIQSDSDEYKLLSELERTIKNIAMKFGEELLYEIGQNAIFRKCSEEKNLKISSSIEAFNLYSGIIKSKLDRAGDNNESK